MKNEGIVALLSPFFFPEKISTGKYNAALAEALAKREGKVHAICSHPLYPKWHPAYSNDELDGVIIHRGGEHVRYPRRNVLRRIVLEGWFALHALKEIFPIRKEIDTVVAVFPPVVFMILVKLILPKNVRCVGIAHDLMGILAGSSKRPSRAIVSKLIFYIERMAFRRCAKIVCLSDSMKRVIHEKYGIANKKLAVEYPFVSSKNNFADTNHLEEKLPDGYRHVVYSGALGEKQIPDKLVEFMLKICDKDDKIMCHIFSQGPVYDEITSRMEIKRSSNLRLHDLVEEADLPELFKRSDVHVIPQASGTGAGSFPSKVPNLLAAGVPVFVMCDVESELSNVISESGIGHVAGTWKMDDWIFEFCEFQSVCCRETHTDRRKKIAPYVRNKFSIDHLVDTILEHSAKVSPGFAGTPSGESVLLRQRKAREIVEKPHY